MNRAADIKVIKDEHPENPRDWDNLGTMICSHKRYEFGDEQFDTSQFDSWEDVKKYIEKELNAVIILPLMVYDHSGISMYIKGDGGYRQHEAWDSGQVGFIYVSHEDIEKEYGFINPAILDLAENYLRAEVETYSTYLEGDVWGVIAYNEKGEETDSLWGLFGQGAVDECIAEFKGEVAKI